jgi:spore coat protein SA
VPAIAYHLLTESEPFSEFHGGAISRWAGNVLRDTPAAIVVCPSVDASWNFPPESVLVLSNMVRYRRLRRYRHRLPWVIHRAAIRQVFRPLLKRLRSGDVVWIHNRPDFALALTQRIHRMGAKVVLHLHNSHLAEWPEELMRQVQVDQLVFVSNFLLKQAQQKFPSLGTSSVLYNGASETIFYPSSTRKQKQDVPVVLFAGRLVEEKGLHILIEAMKLLEQQGVQIQLQIVGSSNFGDSSETAYMSQIKETAPSNVIFLPYRSGVALGDLFREADIFCSPSIWDEPFGMVNVEAFASGLPVVTTIGGGASEIFADGGGVLVERGSAGELAAALRRLVDDPTLRSTLGSQGQAAFRKRFTWSAARAQVQQIHQSLSL